jgi:hypothetical protein
MIIFVISIFSITIRVEKNRYPDTIERVWGGLRNNTLRSLSVAYLKIALVYMRAYDCTPSIQQTEYGIQSLYSVKGQKFLQLLCEICH